MDQYGSSLKLIKVLEDAWFPSFTIQNVKLWLCHAPSRHLRRQENFDLCLQQIQVISSCDNRLHGKIEVVGSGCGNAPPIHPSWIFLEF